MQICKRLVLLYNCRELPPMHSYEIQELAVDYEPELSFESDHSTAPGSYVNEFPSEVSTDLAHYVHLTI